MSLLFSSDPNDCRFLKLALFSCIFLAIAGCSGSELSVSEDIYKKNILEEIPSFSLDSTHLGVEIRASNGFAIPHSRKVDRKALDQFSHFLEVNDQDGVPASQLYLGSNLVPIEGHNYYRLDFPGCLSGECTGIEILPHLSIVSKEEFQFYRLSDGAQYKRVDLYQMNISGIKYETRVDAFFDMGGNLIKYYITLLREAQTISERSSLSKIGMEDRIGIPFYRYARNLVLGTDSSTSEPSLRLFDGVDISRGL